jgi:hypothetical protein
MNQAVNPSASPQWPLTPPTIVRSDGVERRANSRALRYWQELAGSRRFPSRSQITQQGATDLWDHLFIVEVTANPADYRFVMAGDILRTALGRDPTGEKVSEVLPGGMGTRTLFLHQAAVGLKGPVDDAAKWMREDGVEVLYRSILLPLSDDGSTVNALLGAFSFRPVVPTTG